MGSSCLLKYLIVSAVCFSFPAAAHAQRYLAEPDSTIFLTDTLRPFLKRMENLHFSGYIQPQFQVAEASGAGSYSGGNFSEFSNNRFMLRRARMKFDYILPSSEGRLPAAWFSFQIDATERGVNVRDMFVRVYEPASQHFFLTAGLFARPFGYELNLSSSVRETPERGRMSQILMPGERDLGAMLSFEPLLRNGKKSLLKWDAGIFNGQGLSADREFDSFKDIISRLTLRSVPVTDHVSAGAGLSVLYGGWRQATRYRYEMSGSNGSYRFAVDSSMDNIGSKAPRHYYGADLQLRYKHGWGKTELRAEYWKGTQPGSFTATVNPGEQPMEPTYVRTFDGAFFYLLQDIINEGWQLMLKYDWYDPNTRISGKGIGSGFTGADIRFHTLGFGITRYFSKNLKLLLYYDQVQNESTGIAGYGSDVKDNVFTARIQMSF
jgi:hypothetical protein